MSTVHHNLINGQWTPDLSTSANLNPSDLSDVIGEYAKADAAGLVHFRDPDALRQSEGV